MREMPRLSLCSVDSSGCELNEWNMEGTRKPMAATTHMLLSMLAAFDAEALTGEPDATEQYGGAQYEQQVADDRANQRRLHQSVQRAEDGEGGDDELCSVAECWR